MRSLIVVAALCTLAFAGTAEAKVWKGSISDPFGDAAADGGTSTTDLRRVAVRYDEVKGTFSARFRLWGATPPEMQRYMSISSCGGRQVTAQFDLPGRWEGMFVTVGSPPSSDFITPPPTITRRGTLSILRFKDPRLARLGLRCVTQSLVGPSFNGPFDEVGRFDLRSR